MLSSILVVDDDSNVLAALEAVLTCSDFQVRTASDGVQALASLAQGGIDLVVTDLRMPVMDGLTLYRRIREQPATRHLPVILLTAVYQLQRDDPLRFNAYLQKPVSAERLIETVNACLFSPEAARQSA